METCREVWRVEHGASLAKPVGICDGQRRQNGRSAAMPKVCVLLADGFEEIEAITAVDVFRRAGFETHAIGVHARAVRGSHGITVESDALLDDVSDETWDLIYVPGGLPGATNLREDQRVLSLLRSHAGAGRLAAAICAGPIVLERAGLLKDARATSYPAVREQLTSIREYVESAVVVDGRVATSRAVGTALEFSLELVALLEDRATSDRLAAAMLARRE
jgi:4-methyl-5(b-hydroxyethyl)-thiazole monophosphate biosynthesis